VIWFEPTEQTQQQTNPTFSKKPGGLRGGLVGGGSHSKNENDGVNAYEWWAATIKSRAFIGDKNLCWLDVLRLLLRKKERSHMELAWRPDPIITFIGW